MDTALTSPSGDIDPEASAAAALVGGHSSSSGRAATTTCYGCGRPIKDRWLLSAVDRSWHENCLRCSYCQCALAAVGSTLFARADLLLCRRDYLRFAPVHVDGIRVILFPAATVMIPLELRGCYFNS